MFAGHSLLDGLGALIALASLVLFFVTIYRKWIKPRFPGIGPGGMTLASILVTLLLTGLVVVVGSDDRIGCAGLGMKADAQLRDGPLSRVVGRAEDPDERLTIALEACQRFVARCEPVRAKDDLTRIAFDCRRLLAEYEVDIPVAKPTP